MSAIRSKSTSLVPISSPCAIEANANAARICFALVRAPPRAGKWTSSRNSASTSTIKSADGSAAALEPWLHALAETRPDLLDKIAGKIAAAKGIRLPPQERRDSESKAVLRPNTRSTLATSLLEPPNLR